MKLTELEPQFLRRNNDREWHHVDAIADADGIVFLCPKCFSANQKARAGVHSIICWRPRVPQSTPPIPGRWEFEGTGFHDLTLVAGSSSVKLTNGCAWHGFIRNGDVTDC